jgi:hypothetical protein
MAFKKDQRYLVHFTLPDGEHILTGFSTPNIEIATEHYRRIVMQNPEATFDPTKVKAIYDASEVEAAIQALRDKDPSRPLATDLGLDSPARVLTNPEVVPGSSVPATQIE